MCRKQNQEGGLTARVNQNLEHFLLQRLAIDLAQHTGSTRRRKVINIDTPTPQPHNPSSVRHPLHFVPSLARLRHSPQDALENVDLVFLGGVELELGDV